MSAAPTVHGRHQARPAVTSFAGVGPLVRFALRRDRIRLTVWVAVLTLTMVYAPNAVRLAYPDEAQRQARVNILKTPAGIMLGGPMFGGNETDLGVMMANELMLTLIVATSILAILTVIRHTRADEESGAAELVLSSVVGRHARTAAALVVTAAVNAVLALTMTLAMAGSGFAVLDTAAMCVGVTAVAMVFGAAAAVSAQLWRQARTASGMAMAALGAAVSGARRRRCDRQLRQRAELALPHRLGPADASVRGVAVVATGAADPDERRVDRRGRGARAPACSTTTRCWPPRVSTPAPAPSAVCSVCNWSCNAASRWAGQQHCWWPARCSGR